MAFFFFKRQKITSCWDHLEDEIDRAIRKKEFVFYYQPEYDLSTKKILGLEALLRWNHPVRGLVSPMEFIPLLEKSKLIHKLTPFIFNQALKDLKEIKKNGFDQLFMSVNLSVVQLQDPALLTVIKRSLNKYQIDPGFLECEVTETAMVENFIDALLVLNKIDDLKIRLSIDDFGAGYSSFNYLRELNVHKLKIDREFIRTLFEKKSNETILSAIINLGHNLNLTVLAEGIETVKQENWLKKYGCDVGQGFLFSKPLPLPILLNFLLTHKEKLTPSQRKK